MCLRTIRSAGFLLSLAVLASFLSLSQASSRVLRSTCISPIPVTPHNGSGCGIPANVDASIFGDNANSVGRAAITAKRTGLDVLITFRNLPRPDLVLTAWVIWHLPGDPTVPAVFKVADHVSPCAPYTAAFTSGMSAKEPNRLRYFAKDKARLLARLNFNPTLPGEGPLTRYQYAFQKDVPGIQRTNLRMYEIPASGGRFVPTSSDYLRVYDRKTGFEKLDQNRRPVIVRSPLKAFAIAVVAHLDKTTHGVAPGYLGVDHYEIGSFKLSPFGKKTV